jgi:hypothetical protein
MYDREGIPMSYNPTPLPAQASRFPVLQINLMGKRSTLDFCVGIYALKRSTLAFCGVRGVKDYHFILLVVV